MSDEPGSSTVSIDVAMLDAAWGQCIAEAEATVSQVAAVCLRRALPDWAARRLLEVSIVLTDDRQVRELNARHRGRDKPTNVLSFPAIDWGVEAEREPAPEDHQEDQSSENAAPLLLGDVVVARETLLAEAKAQEKEPRNHLAHLVAHGTLHLLGYDHEEDSAAERMEALEVSVLQSLGVPDPYAVREGRPPLASQGPAARRKPGLQKQDNKILAS